MFEKRIDVGVRFEQLSDGKTHEHGIAIRSGKQAFQPARFEFQSQAVNQFPRLGVFQPTDGDLGDGQDSTLTAGE